MTTLTTGPVPAKALPAVLSLLARLLTGVGIALLIAGAYPWLEFHGLVGAAVGAGLAVLLVVGRLCATPPRPPAPPLPLPPPRPLTPPPSGPSYAPSPEMSAVRRSVLVSTPGPAAVGEAAAGPTLTPGRGDDWISAALGVVSPAGVRASRGAGVTR
jgi:hypothetical protein